MQQALIAERDAREDVIAMRKLWPTEKLVERGLALTDLQGYWLSDSSRHFGKRVAVFRKTGNQRFGWTKLGNGDAVILQPSSAPGSTAHVPCVAGAIIEKGPTKLRIAVDDASSQVDLESVPLWVMQEGHNDLFERRMELALEALGHDIDFLASMELGDSQVALSGCELSDLLLGSPPPPTRQRSPSLLKYPEVQSWLLRDERFSGLPAMNRSQQEAIRMVLGSRLSLIQGPPGSGKTRTIAELVRLMRQDLGIMEPILLTAHTNVAVDNLAESSIRAGLRVVRAGSMEKVRSAVQERSLQSLAGDHPSMPELLNLRRHIAALQSRLGIAADAGLDARDDSLILNLPPEAAARDSKMVILTKTQFNEARRELSQCYSRNYALWQRITRDILQEADVICATAVGAASIDLNQIDLPVVLFDEGSMATEPSSLIPLVKGCRQLCIIGDHKQLPPVVTSLRAKELGLDISLFERLLTDTNIPRVMLDEQHRMHPTLSEFPRRTFYDGKLEDAATTATIAPLRSRFLDAQGEHGQYLRFLDHRHPERRSDESILNYKEANLALEVASDLLLRNPELSGRDIGIVTPYLAQVQLLEASIVRGADPRHSKWVNLLGPRVAELEHIEVHTVDGFEGREKAAIIFSTVRSNPQGYVGFLADARRMNVALTRAQRALLVLGNAETLGAPQIGELGKQVVSAADLESLRQYVRYVQEKGVLFSQA